MVLVTAARYGPKGKPAVQEPSRTSLQRPAERRGAACVEFGVAAVLLFALLLGMLELGRGIMVKQALTDAARRSCRMGAQPGTSTATITQEVNKVLTLNNLDPKAATVTVLVNDQAVDASTAVQNDKVSVKVSMPVSKFLWVTAIFLTTAEVESETVIMMRYDHQ
jgi:Flp pilus assembly protein TadG